MIGVHKVDGGVEVQLSGKGADILCDYYMVVEALADKFPKEAIFKITELAIRHKDLLSEEKKHDHKEGEEYDIDALLRRVMGNAQKD